MARSVEALYPGAEIDVLGSQAIAAVTWCARAVSLRPAIDEVLGVASWQVLGTCD